MYGISVWNFCISNDQFHGSMMFHGNSMAWFPWFLWPSNTHQSSRKKKHDYSHKSGSHPVVHERRCQYGFVKIEDVPKTKHRKEKNDRKNMIEGNIWKYGVQSWNFILAIQIGSAPNERNCQPPSHWLSGTQWHCNAIHHNAIPHVSHASENPEGTFQLMEIWKSTAMYSSKPNELQRMLNFKHVWSQRIASSKIISAQFSVKK